MQTLENVALKEIFYIDFENYKSHGFAFEIVKPDVNSVGGDFYFQ